MNSKKKKKTYHYLFNATSENMFVLRSYTSRSGPDMSDFSLSGEINCAYLAEIPFCLHTSIPDVFIKVDLENLNTLSELTFNDLGDIFDDNFLIFNLNYEGDDFALFDIPLYEQAIFCLENNQGFANLPFSDLEDTLEIDDRSISWEQENNEGFANLPFSNLEDEHTSIIDTVYEVLEAFS